MMARAAIFCSGSPAVLRLAGRGSLMPETAAVDAFRRFRSCNFNSASLVPGGQPVADRTESLTRPDQTAAFRPASPTSARQTGACRSASTIPACSSHACRSASGRLADSSRIFRSASSSLADNSRACRSANGIPPRRSESCRHNAPFFFPENQPFARKTAAFSPVPNH